MKSLGNILETIFRDPELREQFLASLITTSWSRAVGKQIAEISEPLYFKDGRLFVKVKSAAWRQELSMMRQEIIERINRNIERNVVNEIVFR